MTQQPINSTDAMDVVEKKMNDEPKKISITIPISTARYWAEKSWYPILRNCVVEDQDVIKACVEALKNDIE